MSSGFKFTVFCLIVVFAVATSQISVGMSRGTRTTSRSTTSVASTSSRSSSVTGSRSTARGVVSQVSVSKTRGQTLLTPPQADSTTTLGALFDLINTNNPAKTSNFIIFIPGDNPSSKSAGTVGLSLEFLKQTNSSGRPGILRNIQVTVKADDSGIIQLMQQKGIFPKDSDLSQAAAYGWQAVFQYTLEKFAKILLYIQLPDINTLPLDVQNIIPAALKSNWGQKFYLIDPWSQSSPIKWNRSYKPEQVCRPYRLLMDWNV